MASATLEPRKRKKVADRNALPPIRPPKVVIPPDIAHFPTDAKAIEAGCFYDEGYPKIVIEFFHKYLRHSKGEFANQPFQLEVWQINNIIRPLFGWRRADGTRRFRIGYLSTAKKQGKTTLASGLGLFLLTMDGFLDTEQKWHPENQAEVFTAACDTDQSASLTDEASNMVEKSAALLARCDVIRSTHRIVYRPDSGVMKALSSSPNEKEGKNIHALLFDELHAQRDRKLWEVLQYGGAGRRQPLFLFLTTAGYDRNSLCYEQYQYAKGILEGRIDDISYFVYIAEVDEKADWTDEREWHKANPNLGTTTRIEDMRIEFERAKQSPTNQNSFRRYRLNQWVQQLTRWIDLDRWDLNAGPVGWKQLEAQMDGRQIIIGADLASTTDLCATCAFGLPRAPGDLPIVVPRFWMPLPKIREKAAAGISMFTDWAATGALVGLDREVMDTTHIDAEVERWGRIGRVIAFCFDPWNARDLQARLEQRGVNLVPVIFRPSGMNAPTKKLEELVLTGGLRHGGHPVLRWCFENMSVKMDDKGNVMPSKANREQKIDGIVALICAVGGYILNTGPKESVYEKKDMVIL